MREDAWLGMLLVLGGIVCIVLALKQKKVLSGQRFRLLLAGALGIIAGLAYMFRK